MLFAAHAPAQDRVQAFCQPREVYVGKSVVFVLEVLSSGQVGEPTPFTVDNASVQALGRSSQSQTQFVQGRLQSTSSVTFRYEITPERPGEYVVPAMSVDVDGTPLTSDPVRFQVLPPDAQDLVVPVLTASTNRCYLFQTFDVVLRIFVRELPLEDMTDREPLAVLRDPPGLQIDWMENRAGLETPEFSEWLTPLLQRSSTGDVSGFTINGVNESNRLDPFEFFNSPFGSRRDRRAVFDLGPRRAREEDVRNVPALAGRAAEYWVYTLERTYRPTVTANYSFGPAAVEGFFAATTSVGRSGRTEMEGREIYAVSDAVRVRVETAPAEGRLPGFTGGVGRFTIGAEVEPRELRVGDPLTLTLRVRGDGNLDEIGPPDLETDQRFTESFKVYEPTSATADGTRTFTWSLRPVSASVTAVPPIELVYFDLEHERYTTESTNAVPISVEESIRLKGSEIVRGQSAPEPSSLTTSEDGLFAAITDRTQFRDEGVNFVTTTWLFAILLAAGPALAVLARWVRRAAADPTARERRSALARADEHLAALRRLDGAGELESAIGHARGAVGALVRSLCHRDDRSATARDLADWLAGAGLREESARTLDLLERWEALQYGGGGDQFGALKEETERWVGELRQRVLAGARS